MSRGVRYREVLSWAAGVVLVVCGCASADASRVGGMYGTAAFTRAIHVVQQRPDPIRRLVFVMITPTTAFFAGYTRTHHNANVHVALPGHPAGREPTLSVFGSINSSGYPVANLDPSLPAELLTRIRRGQPSFAPRLIALIDSKFTENGRPVSRANWEIDGRIARRLVSYVTTDASGRRLIGPQFH